MAVGERSIPVGYEAVVRKLDLDCVPHFRASYVSPGTGRVAVGHDRERHYYSKKYYPGDGVFDNLVFALKYDGVNLEILKKVFNQLSEHEVAAFVRQQPLSKYSRKLWFLYEFLMQREISLSDAATGGYVSLLDDSMYYTGAPENSRRHRIINNLLGTPDFCPLIRKTALMGEYMRKDLSRQLTDILGRYDQNLLERASHYLYTKETRTSFNIEKEEPDAKRTTRFVTLLRQASTAGAVDKTLLLKAQNTVVGDNRFIAKDYRTTQNYIGEGFGIRQSIHYISPRPEDVAPLMKGLLESFPRMHKLVDPIVHAAALAFGFVYIHPFDDGNGRVHRYLIHHVLANEGYTPEGLIFPVSATMLSNIRSYDQCLEKFSMQIMQSNLVQYTINESGELSVANDTGDLYRYMDLTHAAEYLYGAIETTIRKEFTNEIAFLAGYELAQKALKNYIDMPDKLVIQFIQAIHEQGTISRRKREKVFSMLTDTEIADMERLVKQAFREIEPDEPIKAS